MDNALTVKRLRELADRLERGDMQVVRSDMSTGLGDPIMVSLTGTTYESLIKIEIALKPRETT